MTAEQVAACVLEGRSPKEMIALLKRKYPPKPSKDDVDFTLYWDPESDAPEGNFDNPEDVEWIRQQLEAGNEWAWCQVQVKATWTDPETDEEYEGSDYLGGCSYESEESFKQPGGYYDDMKDSAYEELLGDIERRWEPPEDEE